MNQDQRELLTITRAAVERLRENSELLGELLAVMHRDGGHHAFATGNDQAVQDAMQVYYRQAERIAALEEAAREARDALQYKLHVVEAIAKLNAVLGNADNDRRGNYD